MQNIQIDHLTPHQIRQMKKGSKIRIRKGEGLNLTVNPSTYNIVARAFNRDSGAQLNMSPEQISELMMQVAPQRIQQYDTTGNPIETNVDVGSTPMQRQRAPQPVPPAPDMHLHPAGRGILGPHFDRFLNKRGIKHKVYKIGDALKPVAKAGISAGIGALSASAIAMQPEFAPLISLGGYGATALAHDYLDHPSTYQGSSGAKHPHKANNLPQQVEQMKHYEKMNKDLGTNFDYMGKAGLGKASANEATAKMNEMSIKARPDLGPRKFEPEYKSLGSGIHHRNDRTVMGRGIRLSETHNTQALESQPYNENFSMNHMLPPSFQVHKVGDHHISGGALKHDSESESESDEPQHTPRPERQSELIQVSQPHNYYQKNGFSPSVMIPPAYMSQAEDANFVRRHTKGKKGNGLYASGKAGHGLYM